MATGDLPLFIEYLDEDGNSYMRIDDAGTIIKIYQEAVLDKDNKTFYASKCAKLTKKADKDAVKSLFTANTLGRNVTKVDIKKEEQKQLDEEKAIKELQAIAALEEPAEKAIAEELTEVVKAKK